MIKCVAPQRLYLMQVATRLNPEVTWPIPYPCYLVQMSDGKHILIDTGWPEELPFRPGLQVNKNVIEQLALLGLQPVDIDILICTPNESLQAVQSLTKQSALLGKSLVCVQLSRLLA